MCIEKNIVWFHTHRKVNENRIIDTHSIIHFCCFHLIMFLVVWMLLFYLYESVPDVDIKKLIVFSKIFNWSHRLCSSWISIDMSKRKVRHDQTSNDEDRKPPTPSSSVQVADWSQFTNPSCNQTTDIDSKVFVYLLLGGPPRVGPVFLTPPAPSFGGAFDLPGRGNLHPNFRSSFEMICGLGTA